MNTTNAPADDPTYGLHIRDDELMHRAFVFDIKPKSCASKLYTSLHSTRRHIKGAYITIISGNRVFNKKDVLSRLAELHDQGVSSVVITYAPEAKQSAQQARRASNEYSGFAPATNWDSHTEPVNVINANLLDNVIGNVSGMQTSESRIASKLESESIESNPELGSNNGMLIFWTT